MTMKKKFLGQLLTLVCFVLSFTILTSCDKEDENSGKVELLSFGPSGVKQGEEIVFIGQNLNKVTSIVFFPEVEVSKDDFVSQSADRIHVVVPFETETGKVILKTSSSEIESKSIFSLEVPVTITGMTEEARPGETITITGENMNWIDAMAFTGDVVIEQADFVSRSATEIVVTVPAEAKTGYLAFLTGGTEPEVITSDEPLIVTLPTVTNIAPLSVKHTQNITLTGTDLDLVTQIALSGNKTVTTFVSQSETQIVLTVPVGTTAGTLKLTVASEESITTSQSITIILPKGTNLTPKPANPGAENITITGTDLDLVAELTLAGVTNPILANQFVSHSATQIVLALPATAINGAITYKSIHGYSNNLGVSVLIPTAGPPPLDYYIYNDGLVNGWSKWDGWQTDAQDFASTEEVFNGSTSIKVTYNGQYGSLQIGAPPSTDISSYTTFSFRIYAPAAQNFIVQLNGDADNYISVPQGWSEVTIPVANMAGRAAVTELRFKNNNAGVPVTLYIDYVGLKL